MAASVVPSSERIEAGPWRTASSELRTTTTKPPGVTLVYEKMYQEILEKKSAQ